jgi:hypothetical protein
MAAGKQKPQPLCFEISVQLDISDQLWQVDYRLEIAAPIYLDSRTIPEGSGKLFSEHLTAKQLGKPGKARTLIERTSEGETIVFPEQGRGKECFKTRQDMSVLQSLAVRQAEDFPINFPVIAGFTETFLNSSLVRLDPESFGKTLNEVFRRSTKAPKPGEIVLSYEPFDRLKELQNDKDKWRQFLFWLKDIGGIEEIDLFEVGSEKNAETKTKHILTRQHGRLQMPAELSMGNTVILGTLIALYSSLNTGSAILFEEPENHLHPQAIEKLIRLFREFSDKQNIIFSTHSPVVLNSLQPQEVTVMRPLDNGFVTTQKVSDIQEAIDALNRGFLSMGDLLQTNFKNE